MKRTVSLLLLLVLCLAMLPARRALAYYPEDPEAVDWIDTVTLTLPAPQKGGVSVEYTPDWPEDTNYLVSDDDVKWHDVTDPTAAVLLTKKGVFAVGHVYRVEMLVRHWGGCAFENSVAVTLNGAVPDYVALDPDTGHMTVKHTFPAVIEPEVVATVAFTITPPVAGAKPSYAATLPANAHYHLDPQSVDYMENNVFWEEVGKTIVDETGAHEETEPMEPGKDTFQTGKTYRVYIIRFVPDEDYVFSDGLIATINGKAAMVTRDGDDGAYVAYYTFPALSSKPVITVQPQDVTVNEGQTANFSVTATGGELTYAWQYLKPGETTWRNVSKNGTGATYSLVTEARHDGYLYRCKVTNAAGRVYSSVAGLAVTLKPIITQQPVTVTVDEGQTATFAVKATGEDLTYLWQYRKPGEETWRDVKKKGTSATYSLVTEIRHNGYAYRCKVTNAAGSVFSSSAKLTVKPALTITTQPANLETTANREVSFKVVAVGATGYQWEYLRPDETTWRVVSKNGTSATYSLLALFRRDGFKYRCKVSNATSFLYSYAATLTVRVKPSITVQPQSITVYGGKNATFTVVAQGGGLAYKWQYQEAGKTDWIDVERNGTSATCTFKAYLNFNGRKYRCWISNAAGNITSSAVTLTVSEKPVITTQPQDATAKEDTSVTFYVEADGATAYTWQYKKPGEDTWYNVTRNGNASVYRMTAQLRHNGYSYRCRVSNDKGSVLSSEARLTVTPHPVITAQPKDVKVLAGQKAEFKVTATGEAPMSYLWQYQKPGESTWNDVKKNGTSATYALTVEARHDGYSYRCRVSNDGGYVFAGPAKLTVISQPVINADPKDVSVKAGQEAKFTVKATGGDLSYQWQYQKPGENTWNDVKKNGTSATYTLTAETRHNGYAYRCKVTNQAGSATSKSAKLTVN